MSRVFILGAGASRFADYPLALDLKSFLCNFEGLHHTSKERVDAFKHFLDHALLHLPPEQRDRPDLEYLFTLLDLALMGKAPIIQEADEWETVRSKAMGVITDAFLWHEYQLQDRLENNRSTEVRSVLEKWTSRLEAGDTLITFNWDICHEAALWQVGKWRYADGYGFTCSGVQTGEQSPIRVLKLHGSVNWVQDHDSDYPPGIAHRGTFFRGAKDSFERRPRGTGWDEGRRLIIPTYLKDISKNRVLLELWNNASDALLGATEVIVIGYQLNPADALARNLIARSLIRNIVLEEITVVSPLNGFDHWGDLCFALKKKRRPIRKTFEDWLLTNPGPRYSS